MWSRHSWLCQNDVSLPSILWHYSSSQDCFLCFVETCNCLTFGFSVDCVIQLVFILLLLCLFFFYFRLVPPEGSPQWNLCLTSCPSWSNPHHLSGVVDDTGGTVACATLWVVIYIIISCFVSKHDVHVNVLSPVGKIFVFKMIIAAENYCETLNLFQIIVCCMCVRHLMIA